MLRDVSILLAGVVAVAVAVPAAASLCEWRELRRENQLLRRQLQEERHRREALIPPQSVPVAPGEGG